MRGVSTAGLGETPGGVFGSLRKGIFNLLKPLQPGVGPQDASDEIAGLPEGYGLGPERADQMVRANSVARHGIPLSYHSDLPMGPSAPLYLAWCGVNRITPSGRVAGPDQRITIDQALRAITIEAAYSWRHDDWIGSIAPGKIANFTILAEDPYAVDPERLKDIPIWGTVFEGRLFPI